MPPPYVRTWRARRGAHMLACSLGLSADPVEEGEHAPADLRRRGLVVRGQAAVGEQVAVAGIQEDLRLVDRLRELACDVDVAQLVVLHRVDLEGHAPRPGAAELG